MVEKGISSRARGVWIYPRDGMSPVAMKAPAHKNAQRAESSPPKGGRGWHDSPLAKQRLFAAVFLVLFLLLDGSSTASQAWEGAPPCYLPVGMAVALLVYGGTRYLPLLFPLHHICSRGELPPPPVFLVRDSGCNAFLRRLHWRRRNSASALAHRPET